MKIEETEWYRTLMAYDHILIFGATFGAQFTCELMKQYHVEPDCFIVSERRDNPFYLEQKPVKVFEEIGEELKKKALVIISQIYENSDAMRELLLKAGFQNTIPSIAQGTLAVTEELQQYRRSVLGPVQMADRSLEDGLRTQDGRVNLCIYAVTSGGNQHKSNQTYRSDYIQYIQAGAALTDTRICKLTDADGENISEQNPWYCELTAGWWIFKNDQVHDYVGLYHYSRGLSLTDGQLEDAVRKKVDVVLPVPGVWRHELMTAYYCYYDVILAAICGVSPEYTTSAEKFFAEKLFFTGNIVLARKKIYDVYYDWMFQVLRECKKIREEKQRQITPRIWGYYGEILTNVFFMHHIREYQILFSPMSNLY
ncbi:MAG: DUF4422 domain-containing protein [Lachnospiraceae bacterium]